MRILLPTLACRSPGVFRGIRACDTKDPVNEISLALIRSVWFDSICHASSANHLNGGLDFTCARFVTLPNLGHEEAGMRSDLVLPYIVDFLNEVTKA